MEPSLNSTQRRLHLFSLAVSHMAAVVFHSSKDGDHMRTLFTNPVIAVAKARGRAKAGWQVHLTNVDGRVFHPERFDELLKFDCK
jgi:hypothetical protein